MIHFKHLVVVFAVGNWDQGLSNYKIPPLSLDSRNLVNSEKIFIIGVHDPSFNFKFYVVTNIKRLNPFCPNLK